MCSPDNFGMEPVYRFASNSSMHTAGLENAGGGVHVLSERVHELALFVSPERESKEVEDYLGPGDR